MTTQAVTTPSVESIRRIVSLGGETEERRAGREPIAESHVEITLNNDADATTCLAKLEESDRRLAEKIKNNVGDPYDWQMVTFEPSLHGGGTLRFGVVWYDEDFFQAKKGIYMDSHHGALFSKFGVESREVKVTHWHKLS
ncbi:hypothetical protein [Nocardia sp. NPDC057440]|uniref:hypothetical protein n=1 Tax=Nocardia sp. NPDC057440 TaxID=3346134 RepID=UPI00367086AA